MTTFPALRWPAASDLASSTAWGPATGEQGRDEPASAASGSAAPRLAGGLFQPELAGTPNTDPGGAGVFPWTPGVAVSLATP